MAAWAHLHYKPCRDVPVTIIRVIRHGATGKKRDPRVSWFVWLGLELLPLAEVWPTYRRRYSQEHGFRFEKQDLLWTAPRLRTPEQFQRWTDIVAAARNQLYLARDTVAAQRYPWEAQHRGHAASSPAGDESNSGAVGNTCPAASTPRKIAGAAARSESEASATLRRGL